MTCGGPVAADDVTSAQGLVTLIQDTAPVEVDLDHLRVVVHREGSVLHHEKLTPRCRDFPSRNRDLVTLDELARDGCQSCLWSTVALEHQGVPWSSWRHLSQSVTARVALRPLLALPLSSIKECQRLAGALTGVPRASSEYEEASALLAQALNGPLEDEYMALLLDSALEDVRANSAVLLRMGLDDLAARLQSALEPTVAEARAAGPVLLSLSRGWPRELMLVHAARHWHLDRGLYQAPRPAYAALRATGTPVRDDVMLECPLLPSEAEVLVALYDVDSAAYSRLSTALAAARAL